MGRFVSDRDDVSAGRTLKKSNTMNVNTSSEPFPSAFLNELGTS